MNIALTAHDAKKELMVQFCIAYCGILSRHNLCATGTTGKLVEEATGLSVHRFLSGPQGGDQQIAARISCNEIDLLLYFRDPMQCQISVAFLKSEDKTVYFSVSFQLGDLITDPFESCQYIAKLYVVMLRYCISQWCGYDRLHCYRVLRHRTLLNTSCTDVIQKQYTYFIATYQLIRSIRALHRDTYTVCIRVCSEHQICALFLCKIQSQFQSLKDLRVRVAACGEVSIWIFLFRHDSNICHAYIL